MRTWPQVAAATNRASLRVYQRISVKISVSATEFCCHNKYVVQGVLLQRQNSVAETKIFTNILQTTRSNLSLRRFAATCCSN